MTSAKPREWKIVKMLNNGELEVVGPLDIGKNKLVIEVIEKSHADLLERKLKRAMEALKECASTVNCDGRINPKWLIDEIKEIEEMK